MNYSFKRLSRLIPLVVVVLLCLSGCKSRKKVIEISKAPDNNAKIEQEAAQRREQEREEQQKRDAEEQARQAVEANQRERGQAPYLKLGQYFEVIASSDNTVAANKNINEVLGLFATPDVPVLIVIAESGGQKDYDRPTTIKSYLNYLKDQKKNINRIQNLQFDEAGKITEVELRKN